MEKWFKMQKVQFNNINQEPVEEKNHTKSIGILSHHILFDIANRYSIGLKTLYYYNMEK